MKALIHELSSPDAYPHPVDNIEVYQTHISVVFLAGDFAYKLKKAVDLDFVDYSTLEKRRYFCRREVELNQRLAPNVYLGIAPVIDDDAGIRIARADEEFAGAEVREWAVRMKRLDEKDTLRHRLAERRLPADLFERLAHRLARFHDQSRGGPDIDACITFEKVEKNAIDNFRQTVDHVGLTVHEEVRQRLEALTRVNLDKLEPVISRRAESGVARDTHGDLRLEHVYIGDDGRFRIVDCIEFNDAFRYADPVCDIAFLAMDLGFRGYDEESDRLLDSYFEASDDDEGRKLVDFYIAYRSCVRAKVHGFKARDSEVPQYERDRAIKMARAHWLYALARLEGPGRGPSLTLLAGLPATGKSTLGRRLCERGEADILIESDVVRKELAGLEPTKNATAAPGEGIYSEEFSKKTYAEVARRAGQALEKGRRVAVAATFVADARRRRFIEVARSLGVPVRFIECRISDEEAHQRLKARSGDVSDADIEVYEHLKHAWEEPSPKVDRVRKVRDTSAR